MKKTYIFIFITFLISLLILSGCKNKTDNEKQLIGFTLYEKTNPIGVSQTYKSLNEVEINGVYASDDYSYLSIQGDSFFDVKTDSSKLQGDLINKDSVCLFITSNYYQSQNVNYKLFLYEIFLLPNGKYSIEYKTDIQLSSEVGDLATINYKYESLKDDLNYVFTYRINIQKIATPTQVLIKEFNDKNEIINVKSVTSEANEYYISDSASYVLIEEYSILINELDEEEKMINYTLLTQTTPKKNYVFRMLNENNRVINFQVTFLFPQDINDTKKK